MCYGIIYMVRNKKNNKVYIGQTVRTFDERYGGDIEKNTHNKHLQNSIKKYGVENFDIKKCIYECKSKEELDKMEQFYIDFFNSTDPKYGYNKKDGGSNGKLSEETKEKLSESMKKAHENPEYKKRQSEGIRKAYENPEVRKKISEAQKGEKNPMYGKHLSEETKEKLSKSIKKAHENPEYKKKLSKAHKGKHHTKETKEKLSKKFSGKNHPMYGKNCEDYMSEEAIKIKRQRMSEAQKGRHHTEETKEKISKAKKGKSFSDEHKRKLSEARKGKCLSEETKQKISEAGKGKNPFANKTEEEMKEIKEKMSKAQKRRAIVQLDKNGNFIKKWDCARQAGKELNIGSITTCCKGYRKTAGGYKWMYEEDYKKLNV